MSNKKRSIMRTPRTPEEVLLTRIHSIPKPEIKSYAAFVYLFGNRVSEALGLPKRYATGETYTYTRTNNRGISREVIVPKYRKTKSDKKWTKNDYEVPPLLAANIALWNGNKEVYKVEEADKMVVYMLPTFKIKNRPRRDAWVLVKQEMELCRIVWNYARERLSLGDDTPVWTMTRQAAYNNFIKYLGANAFPHKIRDLRATKDSTVYGLDAKDLQEKYNWARPDMAMYYGRKNQADIIHKMKRSEYYQEGNNP